MKTLLTAMLVCVTAAIASDTNTVTYTAHYLTKFPGPQSYKDADSGIILYVESDGRHVAAIGQNGNILWHRDPFADAGLEFYRTKRPQIVWVGQASKRTLEGMRGKGSGRFISITYNNSQFGVLDAKTGDFTFMGQD